MARQQEIINNSSSSSKKQGKIQATDLLNFHFSTSPPTTSRPANLSSSDPRQPQRQRRPTAGQRGNTNSSNTNKTNYKNSSSNNNNNNNRRTKEDRASARRKPSTAMFYLHSSADHAFVLTRRVKQPGPSSSFSGPDEPVSWESVRMVKYLAPTSTTTTTTTSTSSTNETTVLVDDTNNMTASCPICLDAFTCARITKCGHVFCLPCLLRHVHSHTAQNVYTHVKCPCCGIPLHVEDVRPVLVESVQPPRVGSSMTFRKLHRCKHCPAPYLPLPQEHRRASPHAAPCTTDADAPYTRFNYMDPTSYQEYLLSNEVSLQEQVTALSFQRQKLAGENYPLDMEILFYTMSLEMVQKELFRAKEEADEEHSLMHRYHEPSSGFYQVQPMPLTAAYYLSAPHDAKDFSSHKNSSSIAAPAAGAGVAGFDNTPNDEPFTMDSPLYESSGTAGAATAAVSSSPVNDNNVLHRQRQDSVVSEEDEEEQHRINDEEDVVGEGGDNEEELRDEMRDTGGHQRYRGDSIGSEPSSSVDHLIRQRQQQRGRSESITSHGSMESDRIIKPHHHHHQSLKAEERPVLEDMATSMYLDHDATHFYQSHDGQLCFLSRFNMTCLLSDFSTWPPDQTQLSKATTPYERRKLQPLPDVVDGIVVETETVQLTPDTRKRMPFLSHLPLYTDVVFVELDLAHILSDVTKMKLKDEFEKRRRRRKNRADAQKRADRLAKKKEAERVNELKARLQRIDPNDDFFRPSSSFVDTAPLSGDDFGPVLSSSSTSNPTHAAAAASAENVNATNTAATTAAVAATASSPPQSKPSLSFSQICQSRIANPSNGPSSAAAPSRREEFPTLGAAISSTSTTTTTGKPKPSSPAAVPAGWNDRVKAAYVATKQQGTDQSQETTAAALEELSILQSAKKKSKGKKIVLFSTGGQRGSAF